MVLSGPEPTLTLEEPAPRKYVSDCGNGCGQGSWCRFCRDDIREEALRWLRDLNVVRPRDEGVAWGYAWSREFLLANR